MKKLLIIALVFIASSFCTPNSGYYATTWAGTANNQALTITAMNDLWNTYTEGASGGTAPFYPWCELCTIPSNSLQLLTRAYLDANYSLFACLYLKNTSKASNQVLVKSDFGFLFQGRVTSSSGDCSGTGDILQFYVSSDFTKAYTNSAQTTLFNGGGNGYAIYNIFINNQQAYCTIDASGNITSFIQSTC